MTIHYHGADITPVRHLESLHGASFCVSFQYPRNAERLHSIAESLMLDNGAFTIWRKSGGSIDIEAFWAWALPYLDCPTTWAVIPDAIGLGWEETARMIALTPRIPAWKVSPVWHLHDPLERLLELLDTYPRICFGSSAEYSVVGSPSWHGRVADAFDAMSKHHSYAMIHMLRGMQCVKEGWPYPFFSVDSTDIARNHKSQLREPAEMRARWDGMQCPIRWTPQPKHEPLLTGC